MFVDALLHLGIGELGGHVRLIEEGAEDIAAGREQSWEDKLYDDALRRQEAEAEEAEKRWREEQRRAPIYEWCDRCNGEQEVCKNSAHRGERRCMQCGGGVANTQERFCVNCADLPYREMREKALGRAIVYTAECGDAE